MKKKIMILILVGMVLLGGCIAPKQIDKGTDTRPVAPYYCNKLGYEWRIENTDRGGQIGICRFPDGSECDDWAFWGGECGGKWSYCENQGYGLIIKKDIADYFSPRGHIACVDKNTGEEVGLVFDLMKMRQQVTE